MHRIYGSDDAIKLSVREQARLMPEDNIAAVLNKALDVEIYSMARPQIIEPWEVLLKVDHTGICGSDLVKYTFTISSSNVRKYAYYPRLGIL